MIQTVLLFHTFWFEFLKEIFIFAAVWAVHDCYSICSIQANLSNKSSTTE